MFGLGEDLRKHQLGEPGRREAEMGADVDEVSSTSAAFRLPDHVRAWVAAP